MTATFGVRARWHFGGTIGGAKAQWHAVLAQCVDIGQATQCVGPKISTTAASSCNCSQSAHTGRRATQNSDTPNRCVVAQVYPNADLITRHAGVQRQYIALTRGMSRDLRSATPSPLPRLEQQIRLKAILGRLPTPTIRRSVALKQPTRD